MIHFILDQLVFFREEKLSAKAGNSIKAGEKRRFFYSFRPPGPKSYLIVARVFFASSNYENDQKLAEVQRYYYDSNQAGFCPYTLLQISKLDELTFGRN